MVVLDNCACNILNIYNISSLTDGCSNSNLTALKSQIRTSKENSTVIGVTAGDGYIAAESVYCFNKIMDDLEIPRFKLVLLQITC